MFLKLFKYDMLSIAKKMWIYYVVMLGLSVISGLFTLQANITEQPYSLTMFTFVGLYSFVSAFVYIVVIVLVLHRYSTTSFSNQGYLTHTLPVTEHQILLSKILSLTVWALASYAMLALCNTIYGVFAQNFSKFYNELLTIDLGNIYGSIISIIYEIVNAYYFFLLLICAQAIGNSATKSKKRMTTILCFALIIGSITIFSVVSGIFAAFTNSFNLLNNYIDTTITLLEIGGIFLYYFLSIRYTTKHLNLQ